MTERFANFYLGLTNTSTSVAAPFVHDVGDPNYDICYHGPGMIYLYNSTVSIRTCIWTFITLIGDTLEDNYASQINIINIRVSLQQVENTKYIYFHYIFCQMQ